MVATLPPGHLFFADELHESFAAETALGMVSHGGAEPGEIAATCARIVDGDDASWFTEWCATADRLADRAEQSLGAGHTVSAREAYLRAAIYYGLANRPLFGRPVAGRLVDAFARQRAAFEHSIALLDHPAVSFAVSMVGATVPGWFFPAGNAPGPLLVLTNGYDAGMPELFLVATAALRRGYHAAIFDGPGQGRMLVEQGVPLRADWESVASPVLDALLERPEVDADRVALMGWSLGGYLALRAATGDHRFAACIADPGLYGIRESMLARLELLQVPESVLAAFPEIPHDVLATMEQFVDSSRFLHWTLKQRGFWTHGVDSLADYAKAINDFTLEGRLTGIHCSTLVTAAESDPLSGSAARVVEEITGAHSELARFSATEGAGDHCEWLNRSRFDQVAFDWLDARLHF
jgi:pimeloyl-ACP methyl ester carboxylesterase